MLAIPPDGSVEDVIVGAAIFPIFQSGTPTGFLDEGKVLFDEMELLDEIAESAGVMRLDEFDLKASLELPDDFDGDPDWLFELRDAHPVDWHDPAEGMPSVEALLASLPSNGWSRWTRTDVARGLEAFRSVLRQAVEKRVRFALEIAF